jgi:hypothetical protein
MNDRFWREIAGEAVELGDDQRRTVDLAGFQSFLQRRPVVLVLAVLNFDQLLDQLPACR